MQPQMKTQLQFGSPVGGRHYSKILKWEDTTSGEGTTSVFSNSVFGRQYSTVWKREDTISGSETNVTVKPQIAGDAIR